MLLRRYRNKNTKTLFFLCNNKSMSFSLSAFILQFDEFHSNNNNMNTVLRLRAGSLSYMYVDSILCTLSMKY